MKKKRKQEKENLKNMDELQKMDYYMNSSPECTKKLMFFLRGHIMASSRMLEGAPREFRAKGALWVAKRILGELFSYGAINVQQVNKNMSPKQIIAHTRACANAAKKRLEAKSVRVSPDTVKKIRDIVEPLEQIVRDVFKDNAEKQERQERQED